jgi:hypothetical protein
MLPERPTNSCIFLSYRDSRKPFGSHYPSALRGLLTHGLYSEFAGMINGRSVASGWGDGKEGRHCDHQNTDDCNSDDY